jgi:hypothetical protein
VYALNAYLLSLLAAEPLRPSAGNRLHLALELREAITQLDAEGHRRAAHCPIALVDAGLQDETRWAEAVDGTARAAKEDPTRGNFPHLAAVRLAQMTLNLASTAAHLDLQRACLVFGMSPGCARLLLELTLPSIENLAERQPSGCDRAGNTGRISGERCWTLRSAPHPAQCHRLDCAPCNCSWVSLRLQHLFVRQLDRYADRRRRGAVAE